MKFFNLIHDIIILKPNFIKIYRKNWLKKIENLKTKLNEKFPDLKDSRGNQRHAYIGRKRYNLRLGLRKYALRLRNMVNDMHFKLAKDLVHKYRPIYIGKINTKSIMMAKSSGESFALSKKMKPLCQALCPYHFIETLKYMGEKYGTQIMLVSEYLTTRTCSCCGKSNDIKASKVNICPCGMKTERDINAAKNILKVGRGLRKMTQQELRQKREEIKKAFESKQAKK